MFIKMGPWPVRQLADLATLGVGAAAGAGALAERLGAVFWAPPVSHWLTCLAKRNEQRVSCELSHSGATLTSMSVLPCDQGQARGLAMEGTAGCMCT